MKGITSRAGEPVRTCGRRGRIQVAVAADRQVCSTPLRESTTDMRFGACPARDPTEFLAYLDRKRPDCLLLDERLLPQLGGAASMTLREQLGAMPVLLLCEQPRAELVEIIARERFNGFLLVDRRPASWSKAVRTVLRGELWVPRAMLEQAVFALANSGNHRTTVTSEKTHLTRREQQTVDCLCQGLTNRQIGRKLGIREDTVKKHLHNAYGKLGVRCRTQLVAYHARHRTGGSKVPLSLNTT